MIEKVTLKGTTYQPPPAKFEAGTPPIAAAIGLGAAVTWLAGLGMMQVRQHEQEITQYALERLAKIPHLQIYGPIKARERGGLVAFNLAGIHSHDVAQVLADRQVCVRASFGVYTTPADIDRLVAGLAARQKKFRE